MNRELIQHFESLIQIAKEQAIDEANYALRFFVDQIAKKKRWDLKIADFSLNQTSITFSNERNKVCLVAFLKIDLVNVHQTLDTYIKQKGYLPFPKIYFFSIDSLPSMHMVDFDRLLKRKAKFDAKEQLIDHTHLLKWYKKYDVLEVEALNKEMNELIAGGNKILETENALNDSENIRFDNKNSNQPIVFNELTVAHFDFSGEIDEYYFRRPSITTATSWIDEKINSLKSDGKRFTTHLMIQGKPLSGKTRTLYEICRSKELCNKGVAVLADPFRLPDPKEWGEDIQNGLLGQKPLFVFFDDIDFFYRKNDPSKLNSLIKALSELGCIIIATAAEGLEEVVRNDIMDGLTENWDKIVLEPVKLDDVFDFEVDKKLDFDAFKGELGELFAEITAYTKKYELLIEPDEYPNLALLKIGELSWDILNGMKAFHFFKAYHSYKGSYNLKHLKTYIERELGKKISNSKWKQALELLAKHDFLILYQDYIQIREHVLRRCIANSKSKFQYLRRIRELFQTLEERAELGLRWSGFDIAMQLYEAHDWQDALAHFNAQKQEIGSLPTACYNAILSYCKDSESAKSWQDKMKKDGIVANVQTYRLLLEKASDLESAILLVKDLEALKGINLPVWVYVRLCQLSDSFEAMFEIVEEYSGSLKFQSALIDKGAALGVIKKCEQTEQVEKALRYPFLFENINAMQAARLIELSDREDLALKVFDLCGQEDAEILYSSLLLKRRGAAAKETYLELKAKGFSPSLAAFNHLIATAENLKEAEDYYEALKASEIQVNALTFIHLIAKAPDFNKAVAYFNLAEEEGVSPDVPLFHSLAKAASSIQDVEAIMRSMRLYQFIPNSETYTYLLELVEDGDTTTLVEKVGTMRDRRVPMSETVITCLLDKMKGKEQAFVDQLLSFYPQTLNDDDFHRLFLKLLSDLEFSAFWELAYPYIENKALRKVAYKERFLELGWEERMDLLNH